MAARKKCERCSRATRSLVNALDAMYRVTATTPRAAQSALGTKTATEFACYYHIDSAIAQVMSKAASDRVSVFKVPR